MDTRFGFVSGRAAIADFNNRVGSRRRTLPPASPPCRTAQRGFRGTDSTLETRTTVTSQCRTPRADTRFAAHRSGHVRPANRLTIGFLSLHLVGLDRRMEGPL